MMMPQRRMCACVALLVLLCCVADLAAAKKKPPAHPINVNTASPSELEQVPGIGPATAEKILQARKSYGAFKSVDDLLAIRGIGSKRLEKMRKYLTVSRAAPQKPQAAKNPAKPASPAAKAKTP